MFSVGYLMCLVLLCFTYGTSTSTEVSHPYVVSITLRLQEKQIPKLIAESLLGNNPTLTPYLDFSHVSFSDVEEIIGATKVTLKQLLKELNFKTSLFFSVASPSTLLEVIKDTEINVRQVYNMFVFHLLRDPMQDIPKILDSLGVNKDKFITAVVFGTDEEMLEILSKGSFTKRSLENALQVINQDLVLGEVLDFLKAAKLTQAWAKLKQSNSTARFFNALKSSYVIDKLVYLLQVLNVTARDFYGNEAIGGVLGNLVETKEKLLGVVVAPQEILTNSDSVTLLDYQYLKDFVELTATLVENQHLDYTIEDVELPTPPSAITLTTVGKVDLQKYSKIAPKFELGHLNNCSYISSSSTNLHFETVTAKLDEHGFLIINKTNGTVFHIGSPLVCAEFLYGLADWEFDTTISFIVVPSKMEAVASRSSAGFVSALSDFVSNFRTKVIGGICDFLQYTNFYVCSAEFITGTNIHSFTRI